VGRHTAPGSANLGLRRPARRAV